MTPLGVVFLFMLVNWWVEKINVFYSTFTNVFFIFVTFFTFFNVFIFFWNVFYIYGMCPHVLPLFAVFFL